MNYQEILEGITRHRMHPLSFNVPSGRVIDDDLRRKVDEIEWALQALCEKLRDDEPTPE